MLDELLAGEHTPRLAHHSYQQLELGRGEAHFRTASPHLVLQRVDPDRARLQLRIALATAAAHTAQDHPHARSELPWTERLGQVIVRAARQAQQLVRLLYAC